ncbi:hypothetical protein ACF0H5_003066 [Mactra antiquata]
MEIETVAHQCDGAEERNETESETDCQQCYRKFIKGVKIIITFLFSHVGLTCVVVGYAILGGFWFSSIELPEERQTRQDVTKVKDACVDDIIDFYESDDVHIVLDKKHWNKHVDEIMNTYKKKLFHFTKERDWDGRFEGDEYQWSFAESLLYSVTVISTIGYGNITPKTKSGRLITILYGMFGIPLTLLCLRNIGNVMAYWFRFMYRYACVNMTYHYIKLKRRRLREKFAKRLNNKTKDLKKWAKKKQTQVTSQVNLILHHSRTDIHHDDDSSMRASGKGGNNFEKSLSLDNEPILRPSARRHSHHVVRNVDTLPHERKLSLATNPRDSMVAPFAMSTSHDLSVIPEDEIVEVTFDDVKNYQTIDKNDREHTESSSLSISLRDFEQDELNLKARLRETRDFVPISVCLLFFTGYIISGALLFSSWEENWNFLIGFYFCFITLTTTGFGDFVPGMGNLDNDNKIVICVLYLVFGMALIATSFHLMQEVVRHKCTKLAKRIGLVKEKITQMLDQTLE